MGAKYKKKDITSGIHMKTNECFESGGLATARGWGNSFWETVCKK